MEDLKNSNSKKKGKPKKGVLWLLGVTNIKEGLESTAESISESGGRVKKLFGMYKNWLKKPENTRTESFEEAVRRLRLSKDDLAKRQREYTITTLAFVVALSFALSMMVFALAQGQFASAFTNLCISLFVGAIVFYNAMRAWQIKNRKLCTAREFISALLGK